MTRDTAVKASHLIFKIESLEMLIDELENLESLDEYYSDFGDDNLQEELREKIIDIFDIDGRDKVLNNICIYGIQ